MRVAFLFSFACAVMIGTIWFGSRARAAEAGPFRFAPRVIDPHIGEVACYALQLCDVNGDGKQDVVAVSENAVYWYEAPSWRKRVILANQTERDNVCIAAHDIDGDGKVDFALGAGWTRIGTLQWLSRGPTLDDPWTVYSLGKEAWTHRMRFGDVLGTGKPQLIVSPLNKTVGDGVRLLCMEIPNNPRTAAWKTTVIDATLDRMHNHWIEDIDADKHQDVITASQEGLHVFRYLNGAWVKTRAAAGSPPPNRGSGEVKVGRLGNRKFLACIETMHGKDVTVYQPEGNSLRFLPTVIDDSLKEGHAISPADLNGDGNDELIVGDRGRGGGVFVYARGRDGAWLKQVVDDKAMLPEDIVGGDLNGDGRMDFVAGGRGTKNVILYENATTK